MIHFKFVGIKDMHNIYYLGLSGELLLPFGLLVFVFVKFSFCIFATCICMCDLVLDLESIVNLPFLLATSENLF